MKYMMEKFDLTFKEGEGKFALKELRQGRFANPSPNCVHQSSQKFIKNMFYMYVT